MVVVCWPRSPAEPRIDGCRPAPPQIQALSSWSGLPSRGGGSMQYSWPAPVPPERRAATIRLIRCARCGGPLHHTKTKGQPRQEDHELGCEAFIRAIRVMRYVQRTEAVRIRICGDPGPRLAAEILAGEREETVRGGVRERPRRRDQRPWRRLSSRMPSARQTTHPASKDGNGGNANAGLPAVGPRAGSSAGHSPLRVATQITHRPVGRHPPGSPSAGSAADRLVGSASRSGKISAARKQRMDAAGVI